MRFRISFRSYRSVVMWNSEFRGAPLRRKEELTQKQAHRGRQSWEDRRRGRRCEVTPWYDAGTDKHTDVLVCSSFVSVVSLAVYASVLRVRSSTTPFFWADSPRSCFLMGESGQERSNVSRRMTFIYACATTIWVLPRLSCVCEVSLAYILPPFHYIRCFSFVKQMYLDIF
jgi:hypothetical protein